MTEEGSQKGTAKAGRRRHGRFRRWVVRPAFWLLAALAVVALIGAWLLESAFVQERGRRWLESRLGRLLERPVRIAELDLDPLPLTLELRGVEIAGPSAGEPPFATAQRIVVEGRSLSWSRGSLELGRILIESPLVRLIFHEDGTSNLPRRDRARRRSGRAPPFALSVGEFTIRDGAVEVEQRRLPLSVAGRGLRAILLGGDELQATGRVDVEEVELLLPRARPYLGRVAMRVDAGAEGLRIVSGRVSGPHLEADLAGEWVWRGDKGLDLEFDAAGDTAFFDLLGYTAGQLRGPFRFAGGIAWRPQLWGYRGTLTSPDVEIFGRRLTDLTAEVAGDRNGVRAEVTGAGYGAGRVTGEVEYRLDAEDQPFDLRLLLDGVRLGPLLADQGVPLAGVDARVNGPFDYSFPIRSPERGSGRARLELTAGPPAPGPMQLAGSASLTFERGRLRSDSIRLVSDSQHALVAVDYDIPGRAGTVELDVGTERVDELIRLVPIPPESLEVAAWLPTRGVGRVGATLLLTAAGIGAQVRLDLGDVVAPGAVAERVQGAFGVDDAGVSDLRLELLRADGGVIVAGSIPFVSEAEPAPRLPFSLTVDAAGWPAADVEAWFPLGLPLTGSVAGSLALEGEPDALRGRLEAELAPVTAAGWSAERLDLDLEFDEREIRFDRAEVTTPAGRGRASGTLALGSGVLSLEVDSDPLDLGRAPFDGLLPGAAGAVELAGLVSGTVERPEVRGELRWSSFSLGGPPLEAPATTRFDWDGETIEVTGSLPGLSEVGGRGRLDREGYDVELELAVDELSTLLSTIDYPPLEALSGALAGALTAAGGFAGEPPPRLELRLDRLALARDGVTLRSVEPVVVRLAGGELEIETLFLGTPDETNELFVAGRIGLGGDRALDLTAQTSLGGDWLDILVPQFHLDGGRLDLLAAVGGTFDRPSVNGVGRLEATRLLLDTVAVSVEDLGGLVLFYPDRIVLDSFRATAGGGDLEAGGSVLLRGPGGAPSYQIDVVASDLSLSYPEGWQLRGDARASLVSTAAGRSVRGEVELERAYYLEEVKIGLESLLQALFQRRRIEVKETSELMATTALSLEIRGREALRVRNNLARLGGDVDFTVRGTLADPVLFGTVKLTPGGTLVYAGNSYEIERGELNFANPYRIEPIVDLLATTRLRDYLVRLNLSGSPERLDVGVASDPPLPELEVMGLLTGGRSPDSVSVADRRNADADLGVEGFLAGEAASVVTDRVNRLFGLDQLRVSPLTGSSGDLSSARVTVGERISRDLFVTYSYDPSTTEEQILQLEWSVSPTLAIVATQNGDDSYSIDLRWEKAF